MGDGPAHQLLVVVDRLDDVVVGGGGGGSSVGRGLRGQLGDLQEAEGGGGERGQVLGVHHAHQHLAVEREALEVRQDVPAAPAMA